MAGALTISTLNNDTGVLATQNGMTGIAKAWVQFQGGNGNTAGVILASFNVSSITVNGTGDYTANFTTAMPSANYTAIIGNRTIFGTSTLIGMLNSSTAQTISLVRVLYQQSNTTTITNTDIANIAVFSS